MAGNEINISNFSQRIQDFIKEQKIDTDNSGTINKAELAQLLSAAKANGIDMGDVVDFSMPPINPRIDPDANLEGMKELANTIIELNEAKEQDRAEFDEQIMLVHKKLDELKDARENDKNMSEMFTEVAHMAAKKDEEKYQERFNKLLDLVPDDAVYQNSDVNVTVEDDENQPATVNGAGDEGAPEPDKLGARKKAKVTVSQNEGKSIKADIQNLADRTINMVRKNGAMRTEIAAELSRAVEEGSIDEIRNLCEMLIERTHKYAKESEMAMNELVNLCMEALKSAVMSASSDDLDSISNLTNTIKDIKEAAINDKKGFYQFMEFIQEKLVKLDDIQDEAVNKLKAQLHMMTDNLMQKTEEIESRFDKVLTSFNNSLDVDVHDKPELGERYDKVEADKKETVDKFRYNSDELRMLVAKLIATIDSGEIKDIEDLGKMLIQHLNDTNITQSEAMDKLENNAMEFLRQLIKIDDKASGISNVPSYNGQKLDVTPKKIEKDGQMVVAKPVQINGEWKVQLSQVNGISTYDDIDNYPAFFIKE